MDETTSVRLIAALAGIWRAIRRLHPGVPPVIVLAAPAPRGQGNVLGHFAPLRWKTKRHSGAVMHEVVVVAEHLNRHAEDIAATLLHEAAHARNFHAFGEVRDCTASQYHNRIFRDAALELGLDVAQVAHYGYAFTSLPRETAQRYEDDIAALDAVLAHRRAALVIGPPPGPTGPDKEADDEPATGATRSRSRKATCSCTPPFIIRVAKATLDATTIRCDTCGEPFGLAP